MTSRQESILSAPTSRVCREPTIRPRDCATGVEPASARRDQHQECNNTIGSGKGCECHGSICQILGPGKGLARRTVLGRWLARRDMRATIPHPARAQRTRPRGPQTLLESTERLPSQEVAPNSSGSPLLWTLADQPREMSGSTGRQKRLDLPQGPRCEGKMAEVTPGAPLSNRPAQRLRPGRWQANTKAEG